ncbi:hypothetical protein [Rhizobium bangladeshense]|uniref:hypothetical protein n=1 Tax=Rhizobium bangladeshense TaxID=1138189 RepID=UPI003CC98718
MPEGTSGLRPLTFLFDNVEETFARLAEAGVEVKSDRARSQRRNRRLAARSR